MNTIARTAEDALNEAVENACKVYKIEVRPSAENGCMVEVWRGEEYLGDAPTYDIDTMLPVTPQEFAKGIEWVLSGDYVDEAEPVITYESGLYMIAIDGARYVEGYYAAAYEEVATVAGYRPSVSFSRQSEGMALVIGNLAHVDDAREIVRRVNAGEVTR